MHSSPYESPGLPGDQSKKTVYFEYKATKYSADMILREMKAIAISEQLAKIFKSSGRADGEQSDKCPDCKGRFILLYRNRHACAFCHEDYCNK